MQSQTYRDSIGMICLPCLSELTHVIREDPLPDDEMPRVHALVNDLKTIMPEKDQLCGFHEVDYPCSPKSGYQTWIRNGSTKITHHTTVVYGELIPSRLVTQ